MRFRLALFEHRISYCVCRLSNILFRPDNVRIAEHARYCLPGDRIESEIVEIGVLRNTVVGPDGGAG